MWTEIIWCVFRVKPPFSNSCGIVWGWPHYPLLRSAPWRRFHQLYSRVRIEFWRTGLKANQEGQLNEKSRKTDFISCDFLTTHVKRLSKTRIGKNSMLQFSWHWIYSVGTCKPRLMCRKSNVIKSHTITKRTLVSAKGFPYFSYFTRLKGDKCSFPWLLHYLCLHTPVYSRISKTNWCPKGFPCFSNFTRLNDDKCCFSWLLNYLWLHTLVYSVISKTNSSQSFSEFHFLLYR